MKFAKRKSKNRSALSRHYKHQHNNSGNEKAFKCNICTKSFGSQGSTVLHIKTDHGRRHYNCDSCGKSFSTADEETYPHNS